MPWKEPKQDKHVLMLDIMTRNPYTPTLPNTSANSTGSAMAKVIRQKLHQRRGERDTVFESRPQFFLRNGGKSTDIHRGLSDEEEPELAGNPPPSQAPGLFSALAWCNAGRFRHRSYFG